MNDYCKNQNQRITFIVLGGISAVLWLITKNNFIRWTGIIFLLIALYLIIDAPKYFLEKNKIKYYTPEEVEANGGISGESTDTKYLKKNGTDEWLDSAKGASMVGIISGYFLINRLRKQNTNPEFKYALIPYSEEAFVHEVTTGEKLF